MEPRNQVSRKLKYRIYADPYNYEACWDVKSLSIIFNEISEKYPNSKFVGIDDIVEDQRGFGSMELDPIMGTSYYLVFQYYSPETDAEYHERMLLLEKRKRELEEKEKLEYLRLKAKFE